MSLAPRETGINEGHCGAPLTGFDKFYLTSLFFYCFLLFSPTVYALVPTVGVLAGVARFFIAGILTLFALQQAVQRGSVRINRGLLLLSLAFVFLALLPSAYHQTSYLLANEFISFYLVYMFFLFYKDKYLRPLVDVATAFLLVMVALSIIGFVYALLGGEPLMSGATPKGRVYYLYLTTGAVDNGVFGSIIRPQGIYEEPGSFSFMICTLCFLRMLTNRKESATFALMFLGNITFSIIHIIIFVLYVLRLIMKYKMKKAFAIYAFFIFCSMLVAYLPIMKPVNEVLFSRFAIDQATGKISGNNRAHFFDNSLKAIANDNTILLYGLPRDAQGRSPMEEIWIYDGNPITPIMEFGIFIAWLYYFYLLFFVMCGLIDRKNFIVYLSIVLMFLQKPEFYRGGPAADLLLLFFTSYGIIKSRIALRKGATPKCVGVPQAGG